MKKIAISIASLLLLTACSTQQSLTTKDEKHKTASEDLNILRKEITMVSFDRIRSELERDDIRRRHAMRLSKNLIALTDKIKDIPKEKIKNLNTKEDEELYNEYSHNLRKNAESIYKVANEYALERLPEELSKMKNTCTKCHERFRGKKEL
jgi:hypothetical protein